MVRPADAADAGAICSLVAAREGQSPEQLLPMIQRALSAERSDRLVLVAENRGAVIAVGRVGYFTPSIDAPSNTAPEGWYLFGLIVSPSQRRQGVGRALTRARLDWIAARASCAFYFANARNRVSLALHREFGFAELTSNFSFPGASFDGGTGVLCRVSLPLPPTASSDPYEG